MESFYITLALFFAAFSPTHSLQCYQHYSSEGSIESDSWRTVTCEAGVMSCTSTVTIESGKKTKSYGCSFQNTCHEVAHGTSTNILIQSCCFSDLCNNQTDKEFEEGEEYCYSAQCDFEGCLPDLIETMHNESIGAYCKAKENGCQMMKRKELTDGGTWKLVEFIGCSDPYPCIGGSTMTDTIHMDRQCCKGHLCTDGNNTDATETEQDSCYEYYCLSSKNGHCTPPADLNEAVKRGQATLCPRTSKGCYYYEAYGINKHHYEFATGCFREGILNRNECAPMVAKYNDVVAKAQCCNSDRCNSFKAQRNITGRDQCLSMSCTGKDCLATAKQAGSYWLCDKTQHGCEVGVIDIGLESVFTIGCAASACEKGTVTSDGLSVIECCTGDRCLPQALTGGNGADQFRMVLSWILCIVMAATIMF